MSAITQESAATSGGKTKNKAAILTSIITTQLMIVLDMTIIAVALPSMQSSLDMTDAQRPWIVTAYTLAFGGLVLFGGRLVGIVGIRRAYPIGLMGFSIASLVGGLAPSFAVLAGARAAQGVFGALLAPTILAFINNSFVNPKERAGAFALIGATGGIGAAVGLLLGGALTDLLNWRWAMFVNIFIAAFALVTSRKTLPPAHKNNSGASITDDFFGLVLGCTGLFSVVFGLDRAQRTSWGSASTVTFISVGCALLVLFVIRERMARKPVLPLWIVTNPARSASYGTQFTFGAAQMGTAVFMTYYLQEHLGYSPMKTGVAMLPMVAGIVVAAAISGKLILPRLGAQAAFPLGLSLSAAGAGILSLMDVDSSFAQAALPGLIVFGLGMGVAVPIAFNAGTRGIGPSHIGLASATINASQQVGSSFGVAILSTYATHLGKSYVTDHMDGFRSKVAAALFSAQTSPQSADGKRIIASMRTDFADEARVNAYSGGFVLLAIIIASVAAVIAIGAIALRIARRRTGAAGETASATAPSPTDAAPVTARIEISEPSAASQDSASAFAVGASPASQASADVEDLPASEGVAPVVEATSAAEAAPVAESSPAAEGLPAASPTSLPATSALPATASNGAPPTPETASPAPSAEARTPEAPADQRQGQSDVPTLDIAIESPAPDAPAASGSGSPAADAPDDLIVRYSEKVGQAPDGSAARTIAITVTGTALATAAFALRVVRRRRSK